MSLGWLSSLAAGAVYPVQTLLFAYLVTSLLLPNTIELERRANLLSVGWVVLAIVEFFAVFLQSGVFGYASERMVFLERLD